MTFDVRRDGDPVLAAREMLSAPSEPNAATRALQIALSAWGYDFHSPANRAHSNDLLVRQRVCAWLREAAGAVDDLERRYANERVKPPTKEQPFPSAEVAGSIKAIRRLRDTLQSVAARIDALETPAGDRIWNRFCRERALLDALVTADVALLAYAQTIRTAALRLDVEAVEGSQSLDQVRAMVGEIEEQLRRRADLLLI